MRNVSLFRNGNESEIVGCYDLRMKYEHDRVSEARFERGSIAA